jgi:hypothetical protein
MIDEENAVWLLEQFEKLGRSLGIVIRYVSLNTDDEALNIRSGLCRLKDDRFLLVDRLLSPEEKCRVLARQFRSFDLSGVFLSPALRQLIEDGAR